MNNIINKKNLFAVLSMFLFFSSNSSALKKLPKDCQKVICSFLHQKDIFNGFGLSCKEFKKTTDDYISACNDGRDLNIYCSPKNSKLLGMRINNVFLCYN